MKNLLFLATLASIALVGVVPSQSARADGPPPLQTPPCGAVVNELEETELACKNSNNGCSTFMRDPEYQRTKITLSHTNGTSYQCTNWTLTGKCCWAFGGLPQCPAGSCSP